MTIKNQTFSMSFRTTAKAQRRLAVACCLALLVCGCGDTAAESVKTSSQPDLSANPLTIDIWKQSQALEKYSPEALSRLRADNPKLRSRKNWQTFYKEVVSPGFHRDILGQQAARKD